ncbi:hypothetical protein COCCADRAFT_105500, partial [Bipolaris zeicola 26-R-13]
ASHPVRSGIYKQFTGGLVVRWVTTSESPLSYVFFVVHVCVFLFCQLAQVTCRVLACSQSTRLTIHTTNIKQGCT